MIAAYKWLLEEKGFSSKNIAFAGDSAGGNLTVATALAAKTLHLEMPCAIVAFSPWIDMKMTGKSWKTNAHTDACVILEAMQGVCKTYLGDTSLDHPLVDLLHTDLKGLPAMFLATGGAEVLQDDAAMLAKNAKLSGIEVHFDVVDEMQHIWVLMAGNAPEADRTLSQAADFIRSKMNSNQGL
jgi:acetyl esterase/lipase